MTKEQRYFGGGFDPVREEVFLRGLMPGLRQRVLEREIKTAAYEAFLVDFRRDYQWRDGRIYDEESGLYISDLTRKGDRPEEIMAMEAIERGLEKGKMVVNFSSKNEKYDYPQNCVDFWRKDGEKIIWLRFVTKNEYDGLVEVWRGLGGEGDISSEEDLLACPVETDERIADVFARLDFAGSESGVEKEEIDAVVLRLMAEFRREFGEERLLDSEMIFRLFSSVMAETKKGGSRGAVLHDMPIDRYLYGQMMMVKSKTGGCAGFNMIGEFASGRGYFVVKSSEGVKVMKGAVPEDYTFCKKCGVWYPGEKCPFCD